MDWVAEVEELHDFFEAYFLGTATSIDRLEAALAPGFTMVGPHGGVSSRGEIVRMVIDGHAHATSLRIETSEHRLVAERDGLVVGTYVETHHLADRRNDRLTTVVFAVDAAAPHGVRWLHAQETWIT
ncbi:MAG: DUF4440 domain-containing protein [Actinomycetota bacterium]